MPHEHRPAARLARTTPLYATLDQLGAVWGVVHGWERVLCYKPEDQPDFVDEHSFRFNDTNAVAAKEIKALCTNVGVMEVSGFNRFAVTGEGAEQFLNELVCGKIPDKIGKINLCYLLNEQGHVLCEATIAKLGEEHFWYGSAAALSLIHI